MRAEDLGVAGGVLSWGCPGVPLGSVEGGSGLGVFAEARGHVAEACEGQPSTHMVLILWC